MKSPAVLALAFAGLLASGLPISAQLIWNPAQDGGVTPGGSGSWLGANNWYSSSNVTWTGGSAASFSGTAGNVTLSGNTSASSTTFATGGWNIISDSTTNRSLTPGNIVVNSGVVQIGSASAPVTVNLGGSAQFDVASGAELILYGTSTAAGNLQSGSLTKLGDGLLTIVGPKTYVNGTSLLGGTTRISDFLSLGGTTVGVPTAVNVAIRNQATLQITGTTTATNKTFNFTANTGGIIEVTGSNVATLTTALGAPSNVVFNKSGTGTLVLDAGITGGGTTNLNGGTLEMNGATALNTIINNGSTFSGTGSFTTATLNDGGTLMPGLVGNNLDGTSVQWNPGGDLTYNLTATSTGFLTLSGALTKGNSGVGSGFVFNFLDAGDFLFAGQTYDLLSFGSTTFALNASDFSYSSNMSGFAGTFAIDGGLLQFTVVPEPTSLMLLGFGLFGLGFLRRR